jgi:signal transduction histidine kinase
VPLDFSTQWPFAEVLDSQQTSVIADLEGKFDNLPTGAWQHPPRQAAVVPIAPSGQTGKAGILIVGLNPFRRFYEGYQGFINLIAGQIAASIANAQAYEDERKRAEALAEIDRAKTLFFTNVSHELRTPLTLMLGPIEDELSEQDALSRTQRERLEILHRNTMRLLRLVNSLLDFSRIEAGRVEANHEPTDLAAFTTDLASSFRSAIEKAGMRLVVDCPPLTELVYVDREMWEKIILNLLSNAFKYTFEGEIAVTLRQKGDKVEVAVRDTGVGIPKEELPHMFDRFHRVEGTKGRTHEGTGIGLSLAHELVKLHGGTMRIKSAIGEGSTFTIVLPLNTAHLPKERIMAQRRLDSTGLHSQIYVDEALSLLPGYDGDSASSSSDALIDDESNHLFYGKQASHQVACILYADDNADMRAYVSRLLQQHYKVLTVADGLAALTAVKEYHPDMVLTDIMMPGMNGFELLQAIRSDPQTSTMPVILLSARAGEEASSEGMEAGADDYLIKPFNARELLARIGTNLELARIRQEAGEQIRAERQRLQDLFMRAPAIIAVLQGPRHIFEFANPLYMQVIGAQRDIIGKPIREALPELEGQGFYEVLDTVNQTGEPFFGNETPVMLARTGDGILEEVYFNFVYLPTRNANAEIEGILVHAVEVTQQVKARQQIEASEARKDEFLAIASHELKTPVTSVKAYTQLLERRFRSLGDERSSELLARMDMQLDKLTALIGELLDVTRIENGQLLLHNTPFDFNDLINEIVEEVQRTTTKHFILKELATTVVLNGDRERIGQVLTNLLTNAIKYSPQGDTVIVKTARKDRAVITSVQDFGIGIPKEQQDKVFERFFRLEGEKQITYPGLGLGLFISSEFVKRHKGSIWVESEPGKGATFSFSLPIE